MIVTFSTSQPVNVSLQPLPCFALCSPMKPYVTPHSLFTLCQKLVSPYPLSPALHPLTPLALLPDDVSRGVIGYPHLIYCLVTPIHSPCYYFFAIRKMDSSPETSVILESIGDYCKNTKSHKDINVSIYSGGIGLCLLFFCYSSSVVIYYAISVIIRMLGT